MKNRSLVLFTSYLCNYNCSYCAQKNNRKLYKESENLNEINKKLLNTVDKLCQTLFVNKKIMDEYNNSLQIIGGEPSIINLYEIINKLIINKTYIKNLKIFTNFSKNIEYYIKLVELLNKLNAKVILSVSFHDEYISLEEFYKKIKKFSDLISNNKNVSFYTKMVVTNKHNIKYIEKFLSISKNTIFETDIVPCYENSKIDKYVYTYNCNLNNELYNYIANRTIKKQKNKEEMIETYNLFQILKKPDSFFLKKKRKVLPNLWIDYNGLISFPCKKTDINIEDINIEKLYTLCDDIKCQNFNECC